MLPEWWLAALKREIGDRPIVRLAEDLTAAVQRQPPFRREAVYDFLDGKVTTDVMMGAFLLLFPDLPPPVFYASSYEEAHKLLQISRRYEKLDTPVVSETIEDTGAGKRKTTQTGSAITARPAKTGK
jgi:hypothetical protein